MTTPSTFSPSRARLRRTRSDGAIFVEAIIIIASFTLMFLGMVFFRVLYINSVKISLLARGAGIAYSMSGCRDVTPKQWVGTDAGNIYSILQPNPPSNDQAPTDKPVAAQGSDTASGATSKIPGLGGAGFLNPIIEVSDTATLSSTTKSGGIFASRRTIFRKRLQPHTYVTCGDIVRDGSFDEVVDYVKDVFDSKVKTTK
jgi:hypothetical protein